jgi:GNAT superfamily N-acetyltransferase
VPQSPSALKPASLDAAYATLVTYDWHMLNVRVALSSDAPLIVEFQLRMAQESEGLALDRDTLTRGVGAVLDRHVDARYWVAEDEGTVLGMLMTVPEWSDWHNGTVIWVHSVYVEPGARERGVFRALYQHQRAMVEESDRLVGLRLYVEQHNERAMRVYEAVGMTREHYHLYEWLKPE